MTRNGKHTTYRKWWWLGDGLWHCFTHISGLANSTWVNIKNKESVFSILIQSGA